MDNLNFSSEELSILESLKVMGGAINPPDETMTQTKCVNGALACGLTVPQVECSNTVPGCGTAAQIGC